MKTDLIDVAKIWDEALTLIAPKMSVTFYDVWIKNLTPVQLTDEKFYLLAGLESAKNVVNNKYLELITECVKTVHPFINRVIVFTDADNDVAAPSTPLLETIASVDNTATSSIMFDEIYTFDNFVVGGSNEIAYAAAKSVAEDPGSQHNPLFIYGGVGLGKTHIVHAIGNSILSRAPRTKILYVTTETFTNDYIDSLKGSGDHPRNFRDKYRNVDVLMLDDIQFICGKVATQEALFHTFNDLYQSRKQIILTSDCPPKDLNNLEDRLKSRFQSGLTVDISQPDLETRIAILKSKAYKRNFLITDNVVTFIAERIDTNIRALEGALSKVIFYCKINNIKADNTDIVSLALKDELSSQQPSPMSMDIIVNCVCEYFDIDKKDILGKKKTKQLAEARQLAIYLICENISVTLTTIGDYFSRDYSTVIHARDKITELATKDANFIVFIKDITELLNNKNH